MTYNAIKLKWAAKLLKARYFVLMTDTESAILFQGVDPKSFGDELALAAQAAEVQEFYDQLGLLVRQHKTALAKLTGDNAEKRTTTVSKHHTQETNTTKTTKAS